MSDGGPRGTGYVRPAAWVVLLAAVLVNYVTTPTARKSGVSVRSEVRPTEPLDGREDEPGHPDGEGDEVRAVAGARRRQEFGGGECPGDEHDGGDVSGPVG